VFPLAPDVLIFYCGLNDLGLSAADAPANWCYEEALTAWQEPSAFSSLLMKSYVVRSAAHRLPWIAEWIGLPVHVHQITTARLPARRRRRLDPGRHGLHRELRSCLLLAKDRGVKSLVVRQVYRPRRAGDRWPPDGPPERRGGAVARECGAEVLALDRLMRRARSTSRLHPHDGGGNRSGADPLGVPRNARLAALSGRHTRPLRRENRAPTGKPEETRRARSRARRAASRGHRSRLRDPLPRPDRPHEAPHHVRKERLDPRPGLDDLRVGERLVEDPAARFVTRLTASTSPRRGGAR